MNPDIHGLTAHSAEVGTGDLFAALAGTRLNGADFIAEALERGAVAILAAEGTALLRDDVALVTDDNPRRRFAGLAAAFYGDQPGTVAAVTGTNGKSSVAAFTRQIWRRLGKRAASIGTLGVDAEGLTHSLSTTTPDPAVLHRLLADLAHGGHECVVLEASSHGLDQYRLDGVRLAAAAFTNLSRDHLDYHATLEAYLGAKARLFDEVMAPGGTAVLNADAPAHADLAELCRQRRHRVISFGRRRGDLRFASRRVARGQRVRIDAFGKRHTVALGLIGGYQADNAVCALGLVVACGGPLDGALAALAELDPVRGRLEEVARHGNGAPVYVDYAHTPDALAHLLRALRPYAESRLVLVFGCGGDRDKGKRPVMGALAARLADAVIVTDDNPRGEDAAAIRGEIMATCPAACEIGDRREAIFAAVAALGPGDLLTIAGKGHEPGQIVGRKVVPFDDAAVARDAVAACAGPAAERSA